MKILSWNLYNFYNWDYFYEQGFITDKGEAKNFIERRMSYYKTKILEMSPDIMYFYEVGNLELLRRLATEVYGDEHYIFSTAPDKRGIFNACVSRLHLKSEEIFLDELEIPSFVISEQSYKHTHLTQKRGYIRTDLGNTYIYAVHLKSQLPGKIKTIEGEDYEPKNSTEYARAEIIGELIGLAESYGLRKVISSDIHSGRDVILIGDYNADFKSKRLKILAGLADSTDYMKSIFDFNDLNIYSYIYRGHKSTLDYALCSSQAFVRVSDPCIHTDLVGVPDYTVGAIDVRVIGSDHAPITFFLNNKA